MAPVEPRFEQRPALSWRARIVLAGGILLVHGLLVWGLVHAFGGVRALAQRVGLPATLVATVIASDPPPADTRPVPSHAAQGASGATGRKAQADQIAAPPARLPAPPAAPVAGQGSDTQSGASAAGNGTGGATGGAGTGSGGAGTGSGGRFVASKPIKLSGEIAERDYDKAGRARRLGSAVVIVLTVGTDGRASACRIHRPSGDPEADAVTCRLALERFRFAPGKDQDGQPIVADYGWQQRFFWK